MKSEIIGSIQDLSPSLKLTVISKWLKQEKDGNFRTPHIHFKLRLTNGGKSMDFAYSGGILAFASDLARNRYADGLKARVRTVYDKDKFDQSVTGLFNDATPDLAGCLYSLLSDMRAGNETFPDFCSELGYNEDSRKDLATWEACRQIGFDLQRILSSSMISELESLLADY